MVIFNRDQSKSSMHAWSRYHRTPECFQNCLVTRRSHQLGQFYPSSAWIFSFQARILTAKLNILLDNASLYIILPVVGDNRILPLHCPLNLAAPVSYLVRRDIEPSRELRKGYPTEARGDRGGKDEAEIVEGRGVLCKVACSEDYPIPHQYHFQKLEFHHLLLAASESELISCQNFVNWHVRLSSWSLCK